MLSSVLVPILLLQRSVKIVNTFITDIWQYCYFAQHSGDWCWWYFHRQNMLNSTTTDSRTDRWLTVCRGSGSCCWSHTETSFMRRDDPCSSIDGDGDDSEDQHDQATADLTMDRSQPVSRTVFISSAWHRSYSWSHNLHICLKIDTDKIVLDSSISTQPRNTQNVTLKTN